MVYLKNFVRIELFFILTDNCQLSLNLKLDFFPNTLENTETVVAQHTSPLYKNILLQLLIQLINKNDYNEKLATKLFFF